MGFDYDDGSEELILDQEQLEYIESVLEQGLIECGVYSVMLIDMAGNIISQLDNGRCDHDMYSLAALASANFAAVDTMAKIVGEEEFSLRFHKGETASIHFSKVHHDFLLITIFGKEVALGLLRLKVTDAIEKLQVLWGNS